MKKEALTVVLATECCSAFEYHACRRTCTHGTFASIQFVLSRLSRFYVPAAMVLSLPALSLEAHLS